MVPLFQGWFTTIIFVAGSTLRKITVCDCSYNYKNCKFWIFGQLNQQLSPGNLLQRGLYLDKQLIISKHTLSTHLQSGMHYLLE